jgi:organic radical activating enzyme
MVNTTGSIDFCCIAKPSQLRNEKGKTLDVSTTNLRDAWNGKDMRAIRQAMLDGKQVEGCKHCYLQEEVGKKSFRQMHNDEWERRIGLQEIQNRVNDSIDAEYAVDRPPVYLDLRLGNLCNLTCRMCNPFNSSQIAREYQKVKDTETDYQDIMEKTYGKIPEWTASKDYLEKFDGPDLWENINEWLPTLRKVYMTGGEPTMIKNNMDFLNRAAELGYSENINVFMNTNLTNVNNRFVESISKFSDCDINASLDGVGEVNNYIRGSRSWETLYKNYRTLLELPNVNSNITPVLQIYNLNRIHEVLELAEDLSNGRERMLGVDILLNTHPVHLDVRNLPMELRSAAKQRLQNFKEHSILYKQHGLVKNSVDGALGYLDHPQLENWHENLTDFIRYTQSMDRTRNENFSAIDDELYQQIRKLVNG